MAKHHCHLFAVHYKNSTGLFPPDRTKAAKDTAASGYAKTKGAASGAADYASETAETVKDTAKEAAANAAAFINSYLTWGESKAKETKDTTAKSIQVGQAVSPFSLQAAMQCSGHT